MPHFELEPRKASSPEDLNAATDDPVEVDAVNTLLNDKEATDDEISK